MAVIYKYRIHEVGEPVELKIKGFCEVVHFGIDGNKNLCLWAMVSPEQKEEMWTYLVVATGQEFNISKWCHLATIVDGQYVWHLLRPTDQQDHLSYINHDNSHP
jgi:hypothetical protein